MVVSAKTSFGQSLFYKILYVFDGWINDKPINATVIVLIAMQKSLS